MASLAEIRQQYPQYQDMSDGHLAMALHRKFYSDVPMVDYLGKIGLSRSDALYDLRKSGDADGDYLRQQLASPGAGETQEQARVRQEGALPDNRPGTAEGIARGALQGLTFGFGDEAVAAGAAALDQTPGKDFGQKFGAYLSREQGDLDKFRQDNPVAAYGSEIAGAIPTSIAAGGGLVGNGANLVNRALIGAGVGAGQGAVYGFGSGDGDLQDRATDAAVSGLAGGVVGGVAPVIGQAAKRIVTPLPASASQLAAAKTLADEGITLTAGQKTGSKGLQYLESELGGGKAADLMDQQAQQFTKAVLKRAGINATHATPEVLDNAFDQVGKQFDRLAQVTQTPFDQQLQGDMLRIVSDYQDVAGMPAKAVESMMNRAAEIAQKSGGVLKGEPYQNLRSTLGRMIKSADGPTKQALRDLQEALDDAVERNLNGRTLDAWKQARRTYKNLLVIEKAATGAGEKSASGLISPAQLRNAAIAQNRRAFARGNSDFTDLANAAVQTMTPLPQSGTAPRLAARSIAGIPGVIGAMAGSPGGLPGMVAGGTAGAAVPFLTGRALLSRPGMALLSNQMAAGPEAGIVERLVRRAGTPLIGTGINP